MSITGSGSPAQIEYGPSDATVRFERTFDRPRGAVWAALTQPALLAVWLDEASVELRVGGRFEIRFSDGPMLGLITELIENSVLAYSWHEGQYGQSHVRWELSDTADGGTSMTLTHTRLLTDSATGFAAGWHHHLERLGALLDGAQLEWDSDRFTNLHEMYRAAASREATA
jgi:uncharacterized protein YndB with AHSA1/START domain